MAAWERVIDCNLLANPKTVDTVTEFLDDADDLVSRS
jgi:hypothetical protein